MCLSWYHQSFTDKSLIYRMSPMWRVLYSILMVEGSVNYKKEAMRGFILHQPNPPCRDVDTSKLIPCTVTGQDDYERLVSVNSANPSPPGQLKINCKGGSNNMTCLPLSLMPVRYFCACVSEKSDLNTGIGWNDTWEETTGPELTIKRSTDFTKWDRFFISGWPALTQASPSLARAQARRDRRRIGCAQRMKWARAPTRFGPGKYTRPNPTWACTQYSVWRLT